MTWSSKYVKMPDEGSTHVSNLLLCNAPVSNRLYLREKLPENFSDRAPCQIVAGSAVSETPTWAPLDEIEVGQVSPRFTIIREFFDLAF